MSLHDSIKIETDLPDGGDKSAAFQTKDLGEGLMEYRITRSARLEVMHFEPVAPSENGDAARPGLGLLRRRPVGWRPAFHHGFLTFYDCDRTYTANFTHGRLIGIRAGNPDVWIGAEQRVDPWEVLEHVHAALERLDHTSDATLRIRDYVGKALSLTGASERETVTPGAAAEQKSGN
jgi:hypothetical protein